MIKEFKNIEYCQHKGKSIQLDLYLPEGEKKTPLLIWIHGGGWETGDRTWVQSGPLRQVRRGYALASVSYSLTDEAIWPTQIQQLKTAIRFLRANSEEYNIDNSKFVAWGNSAGGHLASLLGTTGDIDKFDNKNDKYSNYSSNVQGVIAWYPTIDLLLMTEQNQYSEYIVSKLLGCSAIENQDKLKALNPINYLNKNTPPFLIMHGKDDEHVSYLQSVILYKALQERGINSELVLLDNLIHGDPQFNNRENSKFFQEFLDNLFL